VNGGPVKGTLRCRAQGAARLSAGRLYAPPARETCLSSCPSAYGD